MFKTTSAEKNVVDSPSVSRRTLTISEKVVLGFADVFCQVPWWEVSAFVHPDVVLRMSAARTITGRGDAIVFCREFCVVSRVTRIEVIDLEDKGSKVYAEHRVHIATTQGRREFTLFASYQVKDRQITSWTRIPNRSAGALSTGIYGTSP